MKVGIFLHKYFPYGGQQRDFVGIARALLDQGAEVEVSCRNKRKNCLSRA